MNRIRVFRAETKMSQASLAARVGVSRQAINAIENGRHDPSLTLAYRIAHALGGPIEAVFPPPDFDE